MKKALIITGSVLGIILIGVLIWFFFFRGSVPGTTGNVQNVLPFGSGEGTVNNTNLGSVPGGSGGDGPSGTQTIPNLFKLSDVPVVGGVAFIKNGSLAVRYVERATGHIVDVRPTTLEKVKIINTTIPKVYDAVFKKDGSSVVFRTLPGNSETISSVSYALIPPATTSVTTYTTVSTPLRDGINEISAGVNNIFYTTKEGQSIISSTFNGTQPRTLFTGAFNEWRLSSGGDSTVFATTKASSDVHGFSYTINSNSTSLSKLLGPLAALTVSSNTGGSRILYGWNDQGIWNLSALNVRTGATINILPATLPEKCLWSTDEEGIIYCGIPRTGVGTNQPENWYQGITHYSDRIWVLNVDTTYASIIADPKENFGVDIDAEKLFLSPDEDYLFFTNRNDLTLWALKLN